MESGFYKVIDISNTKFKQKSQFIWIDDPDHKRITFLEFSFSSKFLEGCKILPIKEGDDEFRQYLEHDIKKVEKDINKLQLLQSRLIAAQKEL